MRKFIREAECIPKYYGIAYRDMMRNGAVCYPLGLNVIMRVVYHVMIKIKNPRWSTHEEKEAEFYGAIYVKVHDNSYQQGRRAGIREYQERFETIISENAREKRSKSKLPEDSL